MVWPSESLAFLGSAEPLVRPSPAALGCQERHPRVAWKVQRRRTSQSVGVACCVLLGAAHHGSARQAHHRKHPQRRLTRTKVRAARSGSLEDAPPPQLKLDPEDPSSFVVAILGDLHLDPRDLEHHLEGRSHIKAALAKDDPVKPFVVSLGDLGESKDCTQTEQLYSGTSECFSLAREYLDGFEAPFDVVAGNHDLEGIDEFETDEANMGAFLQSMGKETPEFCHQIADKTLLVGLSSSAFRRAPYTSHEVCIDSQQLDWFEDVLDAHPASEDWQIFVFSHAPIVGSGLRVLQEVHVLNGCAWLNHTNATTSKRFISIVRKHASIKAWFSGHFHLSHDYEDSITFPGGNNRGSCIFAQTGVMTSRSSRDGRRQTRLLRGNSKGFEICTINHLKDGDIRLDATVTPADACYVGDGDADSWLESTDEAACSVLVYAHNHVDFDHSKWFRAYTPRDDDGCYIDVKEVDGVLEQAEVCWWHMKDGAVLGVHDGMILEYDCSTRAPLGMVVSRDELQGRQIAVIDDGKDGSVLVLYDDGDIATVVQPNEDGTYWRRVVRNKLLRVKEMQRVAAARKWMAEQKGGEKKVEVLSSYGPCKTYEGQAYGLTTQAVNPRVFKAGNHRQVLS